MKGVIVPRHHRHHRRFRTSNTTNSEPESQTLDLALGAIRQDLQKTLFITIMLAVSLIGLSLLNNHYHWTISWGATLYRLLHIR